MERRPSITINHEALFGPWRPMSSVESHIVDPTHVVISGSVVKVPMIPERIYGSAPINFNGSIVKKS